jgi:lipopolysaccharide/colanic/teichoic acid biosynthesis glycosyltransferase
MNINEIPNDEPEEAFPYLPPTDELLSKYSHIFALTDPVPLRLDKWIFDKVISLAVLVVAAPLLFFIWCAYKIEGVIDSSSRGPVFYYYWSISAGRKMKKLKIRAVKTQYIDPDLARLHDWRANKGEWNVMHRTRVGHFAKTYYLDELPQFWSVLIGHMSIVGPRPLAIHHFERDLAQGNVARKLLRGGILGFGHIRKGTSEMGDPRFEYEYIHEYLTRPPLGILAIDAWILWKGFNVIIAGKGL